MTAKNKSFDRFTLVAVALIFLAVLYFAYNFWLGIAAPAAPAGSSLGQFKVVNSAAIGEIKELNACGNWPLKMVGLSAERGNPFNRQSSALPQMTATSSISCLPVTQ